MVNATTGKPDRGIDVFGFKVGHFIKDLLRRESSQEQIQNISDADAHAANAGASATLVRVEGDAFLPVSHNAFEDFRAMLLVLAR
jgi:hypothetical protein